jgi:hypothetical protein
LTEIIICSSAQEQQHVHDAKQIKQSSNQAINATTRDGGGWMVLDVDEE